MKGNNSIFLRRSFFPRYALGMPSFNNSVGQNNFGNKISFSCMQNWNAEQVMLQFAFTIQKLLISSPHVFTNFFFTIFVCKINATVDNQAMSFMDKISIR